MARRDSLASLPLPIRPFLTEHGINTFKTHRSRRGTPVCDIGRKNVQIARLLRLSKHGHQCKLRDEVHGALAKRRSGGTGNVLHARSAKLV